LFYILRRFGTLREWRDVVVEARTTISLNTKRPLGLNQGG
jgi:hypothetical protein